MIRAIVVPGKHDISSLMIALKEAEIKLGSIPVHVHQWHKETQQLKYKDETPTVMLNAVQINETTSLCIPTE